MRLFTRYGVRCMPAVICAFPSRLAALTEEMCKPSPAPRHADGHLRAGSARLTAAEMRRLQSGFCHRWLLAGAWRRLRPGTAPARGRSFACSAYRQSGRWVFSIVGAGSHDLSALTAAPRLGLGSTATR